ncbi:lyase [Sphingomonas sinipercae]|uniref:Lyase n=1 Tax=Sphingomonas sinipercae TaxID=2714944 RepID=A0A6G7ZNN3_9SPHN|nr:HEAT repeat domain-containing protein [Sphingomonas sinipercae]QIL02607.1 lyase [Sphingomonas sinipercae]
MSWDDEPYLPASEFLVSIMNEEVVLDDSEFGRANLSLLIGMTKDQDRSNRDYAAMLLGHHGPPTVEVRNALREAAEDEDVYVRGEAIQALVERDRQVAISLVTRELARKTACYAIFQAAADLAETSLAPLLEPFAAKRTGTSHIDSQIDDALAACRKG